MNKEERQNRIVARGEHSGHSHVITGKSVTIEKKVNKTIVHVGEDSDACIKHLLENDWIQGKEVWTKEHKDIPLKKGSYEFVQQSEYDPYEDLIKAVRD